MIDKLSPQLKLPLLFSQLQTKLSASQTIKTLSPSSLQHILLSDLINPSHKQAIFPQVIRLVHVNDKGQVEIDQQALQAMQRFFNQNVAFVGVYGPKSTGKSTFCDVLLKLAQIENDYSTKVINNHQKAIYFYSIPFQKTSNFNVFLLDCVGFDNIDPKSSCHEDDIFLDIMMILCSSIIFIPSVSDKKGEIYKQIYQRIFGCSKRIISKNQKPNVQSALCVSSCYCLYRNKSSISHNSQQLQTLFSSYNFMLLSNAFSSSKQSQFSPQNVSSQYVRQCSRLMRQVITGVGEKKYKGMGVNGSVVCRLLIQTVKVRNQQPNIHINHVFQSIFKDIYQTAYLYHIDAYNQKLQTYFIIDQPYSIGYVINAFQQSQQFVYKSFQTVQIQSSLHDQYQHKLLKYIDQKQQLILQINRKKTRFYLKNKLKQKLMNIQEINQKQQIFDYIKGLKRLQIQKDHDRCNPISLFLISLVKNVETNKKQQIIKKQQQTLRMLTNKMKKQKQILSQQKSDSLQVSILNNKNQAQYQKLVSQIELCQSKLKNNKRQIQIEKKFQKQYIGNKQTTKQHTQRLLLYRRELEDRKRQNQKTISQINRNFQFNSTIDLLNKRIEEKRFYQKQIDKNQSESSQKNLKRKSQVRNITSSTSLSALRLPSAVK